MDALDSRIFDRITAQSVAAVKAQGGFISARHMSAAIATALRGLATAPGCTIPKSLSSLAERFEHKNPNPQAGWFHIRALWKLNLPGLWRNESRLSAKINARAQEMPGCVKLVNGPHSPGTLGRCRVFHASLLPVEAQQEMIRRGLWDGTLPGSVPGGSDGQ